MKSREPHLYEELIGQYLTEEEACQISQNLTSVMNLSNILLRQMDYEEERKRRDEYESEEESEVKDTFYHLSTLCIKSV